MLNSFFMTMGSGSPPDPNIYYRTYKYRGQVCCLIPIFILFTAYKKMGLPQRKGLRGAGRLIFISKILETDAVFFLKL